MGGRGGAVLLIEIEKEKEEVARKGEEGWELKRKK